MKWTYIRKGEYDFFRSPEGVRFVIHYSGLVYLPASMHSLGEAYALAAIKSHYVQPVQDDDGTEYVEATWLATQRHNGDRRSLIEGVVDACRRIRAEKLINRPFLEQWLHDNGQGDMLEYLKRKEEDSANSPNLFLF